MPESLEKKEKLCRVFPVQLNQHLHSTVPPSAINQPRKTPLYPRKEYLPGPVFFPYPSPSKFLSRLPANVNYNLNMNIGACIGGGIRSTILRARVTPRARRKREREKKKEGEGTCKWRETHPEKLHPVRRKSINIHSYIEISEPEFSLKETRILLLPIPFLAPLLSPLLLWPVFLSCASFRINRMQMRSRQWPWRTKKLEYSQCRRDASKRCRWKFTGIFFPFSLSSPSSLSFSFFFSRQGAIPHSLRLRIFFFFFRRILFEHVLSRVHSILFGSFKSKLELFVSFFSFFFFARARW